MRILTILLLLFSSLAYAQTPEINEFKLSGNKTLRPIHKYSFGWEKPSFTVMYNVETGETESMYETQLDTFFNNWLRLDSVKFQDRYLADPVSWQYDLILNIGYIDKVVLSDSVKTNGAAIIMKYPAERAYHTDYSYDSLTSKLLEMNYDLYVTKYPFQLTVDGDQDLFPMWDASEGIMKSVKANNFPSMAALGEANTSSNGGTGGIGLTLAKSGIDLPFKSIYSTSNRLTVADGGGNNRVELTINEGNVVHDNLSGIRNKYSRSNRCSHC